MTTTRHRLTMCEPERYAIRVRGAVNPAWSDRFDCLLVARLNASGEVMTDLVGTVPDQAALLSVLNSLDEIGVSLLSVGLAPRQ